MTDNNLKITYKGIDIVDTDISTETTKTLKTSGKYCEGDIIITAQGGSGGIQEKYGIQFDSLLATDVGGVLSRPTVNSSAVFTGVTGLGDFVFKNFRRGDSGNTVGNITGISFPNITSISGDSVFNYSFYYCNDLKNVSFQNLTEISGADCFYYGFQYSGVENFSFPNLLYIRSGASNCFRYALANDSNIKSVDFSKLKKIEANYAFSYFLYGAKASPLQTQTDFVNVNFDSLEEINATYAFQNAFNDMLLSHAGLNTPIEISFKKLTKVTGNYAFDSAFSITSGRRIHSLKFPVLESVNGNSVFNKCCSGTAEIQDLDIFPKLKYINNTTGYSGFSGSFDGPNSDPNFWFKSLEQIGHTASTSYLQFGSSWNHSYSKKYIVNMPMLERCYSNSSTTSRGNFYNCTKVEKYYFPKLTVLGTYGQNTFNNNTSCTEIHFGKENEATVKALNGYSTKFGATNATIYFDCINHITVNGVVYDRYGTDYKISDYTVEVADGNRYSWKDSNNNLIFTTKCWTPAVGDNVYDENDGVVGTISAVA